MDLIAAVQALRKNLSKQIKIQPIDAEVTVAEEVIEGTPCFWINTPETTREKVILYIHGGSNIMGGIAIHESLVSRIADHCKVQVLFVEYSLAPEHPFPKAITEIVAIYKALVQKFDPQDILLMGESAGAQNALALMLQLKEDKVALPKAFVGLSPAVDLSPETIKDNIARIEGKDPMLANADEVNPFFALYYQDHDPKNPLISPYYGDLAELPPMLIYAGLHEALVFQNRDFVQKAKEAGVEVRYEEYDAMPHVWMFYDPSLPESKKSYVEIAEFVRQHLRLS
ncbi:hypothetical protein BKI52_23405 [marine bacterium AO1-C]|nr:hypothetical protein BKI52_23405 [marine bacterium AO1-C]